MLLTLGDQQKHNNEASEKAGRSTANSGVVVHGGEGLLHSIACTRSFVLRQALRLKVDEMVEEDKVFEDENVRIKALFVNPVKESGEGARLRAMIVGRA